MGAVSIVIPARNDGAALATAVESCIRQADVEVREIVIALAPSEDDTEAVARALEASDGRVTTVLNPSGRTAAGLNLAIAATTSDIVARVDARSELPERYLAYALQTLERTGAVNVGAIQVPTGTHPTQRGIAAAMRSKLGNGGAAYRGASSPQQADTGYLGVFRRAALDGVGGYDENFTRNQDAELNLRLRQAGEVWIDPRLTVAYAPRQSLSKLASQYWQYGWWRRITGHKHKRSLRLRQLLPPVFVLAMLAALVAGVWLKLLLVIPAAYLLVVALAAMVAKALTIRERFVMAAALVTMHFAWGVGFLACSTRLLFRSD